MVLGARRDVSEHRQCSLADSFPKSRQTLMTDGDGNLRAHTCLDTCEPVTVRIHRHAVLSSAIERHHIQETSDRKRWIKLACDE